MSILRSVVWIAALLGIALITSTEQAVAQNSRNSYAIVDGWAKLPGGREMGAVGKATIDPDGRHIWAVIRCDAGATGSGPSAATPIWTWPSNSIPTATSVESFGGGLFIWPHGIDVDSDGNVWVTDGVGSGNIPEGDDRATGSSSSARRGEVLMILGTGGEEGSGRNHFTSPSDVCRCPKRGRLRRGRPRQRQQPCGKVQPPRGVPDVLGQTGYGPGEFRGLHAIDIDPSGRVFVGDRGNNRIQIFDQQGNYIAPGPSSVSPAESPSDNNGRIYVADSESDDVQNPGWEMGDSDREIETGWVTEFIRFPWADPRDTSGNGAEFIAVDRDGNMYGGEPRPRQLRKYMRVRP